MILIKVVSNVKYLEKITKMESVLDEWRIILNVHLTYNVKN